MSSFALALYIFNGHEFIKMHNLFTNGTESMLSPQNSQYLKRNQLTKFEFDTDFEESN